MGWAKLALSAEQKWTHLAARLQAKGYRLQVEACVEPSGHFYDVMGVRMEAVWHYERISLVSNGLRIDGGFAISEDRKADSWRYELELIERLERTLDAMWRMGDESCGGA